MSRAWTPLPADDVPDGTILFDGVCVLCSRWVRFVAVRDAGRFRFTPVQSPYGTALARRLGIDPAVPETNAVVLGGVARFKSDAALAVLGALPGWGWVRAGAAVPRPVRDWLYDGVAGNRYRLFGRTESCMVPPPGLARRVIHDLPADARPAGPAPARTVVVVGGTGAFGERLVRGLAATTALRVVVAARGLPRAEALAAALNAGRTPPRIAAARLDAEAATAADLRALDAFAVVDAGGPFRPGRDRLARAAIGAGAHYLDLADGRDFVAGFAAGLDAAARAAGVVALTGASSTPALSCAVLDHLTAGWARVDTAEVAILPGNRAPRGLAVVRSILGWAGQPVRVFLDGRWVRRPGWGLTRRLDVPGLGRRWSALADTPDLDAVPARYRVARSAVFRAGLELPVLHLGLLAASLAVRAARRCGVRLSLAPLAVPMRGAADLLHPLGSDRGGMTVAATGLDAAGEPLRRRWTLVAEAGDGPVIPTLPALAALRALAAGAAIAPGARPCVGVLDLPAIAAEFAPYRITTATAEDRSPAAAPLFARVMGEAAFAALPDALRIVHAPRPWLALAGRSTVAGPRSVLACLAAALFRLPASGTDVPVRVTIEAVGDGEVWRRDFGGQRFRSRFRPVAAGSRPAVEERFGPFAFRLALAVDGDGLRMRLLGWRCGPVPLPLALAPRTEAREWLDSDGRFRFDVTVALPLAGHLVGYSGWLRPERP